MTRRLLAACVLLAAAPAVASAQAPRPAPRPPSAPRLEVGVGGGIAGGLSLGDRDAELRANGITPSPFRLFSSDTSLGPAAVADVRLGYQVSRRLMVEGMLTIGRPTLTSSLGDDAENAAAVEASTSITEYLVTGGATWRLSINPRRRWIPFVSGGGGVARHVYEGRALVEDGIDVHAGGGIMHAFGPRTGLRVDGRVHVLSGGVAEGAGVSPRAALTGSIFFRF